MTEQKDEAFLQECRSVARCFLYFSIDEDPVPDTRSPDAATRKTDGLKKFHGHLNEELPNAVEAGRKLRELGDRINDQMKAKLEEELKELWQTRSVWEVGRAEFSGVCDRVLTRCQDVVQNGWERVWVVFSLMGRFVEEVRQQEGTHQVASDSDTRSRDAMQPESRDQTPSLRERNLQDFACDYIRDSGLQEWIEEHGGMVCDTYTWLHSPHFGLFLQKNFGKL